MSEGFIEHVIDRSALPSRYPTHAHEPKFWEALGRAVATFGFLEDVLSKAIFALTVTTRYKRSDIEMAYREWLPKMERALVDPLGSLVNEYEKAIRGHTDANVDYLDGLLKDLRNVLAVRNVICHGFWDVPNMQGATVPSFISRKKEVFATAIDTHFWIVFRRALLSWRAS